MALQIDQQRAIDQSLVFRPIIDPQHPRCRAGGRWCPADHPQQGRHAGGHPQQLQQPRTEVTANSDPDRALHCLEPLGFPRPGRHQRRQAFAEDFSRASLIAAEKPSDLEHPADAPSRTGYIA